MTSSPSSTSPTGEKNDQQCAEELIARLSHRQRSYTEGMISITEPAKPSSVQNKLDSSPSSFLEALPIEILHLFLADLDFQSLSRFLRVSHRCKAATESLPAYRDILAYAPDVLNALGLTKLLYLHSATSLHTALRSAPCVSCGEFGPYLFLPTCERCCFECLLLNQSLWVIPLGQAKKTFELKPRHSRSLPVLYSIPGVYGGAAPGTRRGRSQLVSVGAAKQLAISVHGSISEASTSGMGTENVDQDTGEFSMAKFFRNAPFLPLSKKKSALWATGGMLGNKYWGVATLLFPFLPPSNIIENGLWCRGCEWILTQYLFGTWPTGEEFGSQPEHIVRFSISSNARRAWSKDEFLEHIKHCNGVQELEQKKDRTDLPVMG